MNEQDYANHAHRPLPTLLGTALWAAALAGVVATSLGYAWGPTLAWAGVLLCLFVLLAMGRLYTTKLQDRIIMLEERLRASTLLSPSQMARWGQLSAKQIAALRFAGDAELPALFERAVTEGMRPDAIKRAVGTWRADPHRT